MKKKVICVLVLYNSNVELLSKVISAILPQVDLLWISDNSIEPLHLPFIDEKTSCIIYRKMPGNIGIAAAQNYGVRYAIENNFDYLFFLDQDSISPANIINELLLQYDYLCSNFMTVGAIGPRAFNRCENKEYRGNVKKGKKINNEITEVSELISSASLIAISNFEKVGLMDETLFIDGVDHEWCWRANLRMGGRFFIVETIKLSHHLGEGDRHFLWKKVPIPTCFRTYYQYRNYFILLRRNYVPIYWKVSNGIKYMVKLFYYPLCVPPRLLYIKNIWKGIRDGIILAYRFNILHMWKK